MIARIPGTQLFSQDRLARGYLSNHGIKLFSTTGKPAIGGVIAKPDNVGNSWIEIREMLTSQVVKEWRAPDVGSRLAFCSDRVVFRSSDQALLLHDLKPGKRLYLLSTGTGAAPFMSVIKDPEVYDRFEHVILVHGVRWVRESAVVKHLIEELRQHEFLGELVREKLHYYPTISREPHPNYGRLTTLIQSGKLFEDLKLPALDAKEDRVMVCGSPGMLADTRAMLDSNGFHISPHIGEPGDYVIERAFVEK